VQTVEIFGDKIHALPLTSSWRSLRVRGVSKTVRTTCPYCAVQCNFDLHLEDGLAVKITPTKECAVAGGTVCKKGLASLSDLRHNDRLTSPLLRVNGELRPVSWQEALDAFAARSPTAHREAETAKAHRG